MKLSALRPFLLLAVLMAGPAAAQTRPPGFYYTVGPDIVDARGTPVVLRGLGLGGWLMPEGYMLDIAAPDGGSPRTIRAQIEALVGKADTDAFFERYTRHYVREKDIAAIAAWGFDHVRLPFHYALLYDGATGLFKEDGFALLDTFLAWCRLHGLRVILDMHAAPGAQSAYNIADSDGTARLWTEPHPYQDQTVEIWTEIARRYAADSLIIGYDLINEPVLPQGVPGTDLRALYVRLAAAIRPLDPHHILFIEGNHYATDFSALVPPFDANMVYAFHKYWNDPGVGTIQYLLDIRAQHGVPLWLGETGENANPWFFAVRRMAEANGISWNWWTHKKITTTTAPLSAPWAPGYDALVRYWQGSGSKPTAAAARAALFAQADYLDIDSSETRPGVLASLLDDRFGTTPLPFRDHRLPGTVDAADYDLGNQNVAYSDKDPMTTGGSPGGGNTGGQYRNDGVDIERSSDAQGAPYNVGWIEPFEWLNYTVTVETAGRYDVEFRVASGAAGGQLRLLLDGAALGEAVEVPATGGWQAWRSVFLRGVALPAGPHALRLTTRTGGFNLGRMRFTLVAATGAAPDAPPAPRWTGHAPDPMDGLLGVAFEAASPVEVRFEMFDLLGRRVYSLPAQTFGAGAGRLVAHPALAAGTYLYRLHLDDGVAPYTVTRAVTVAR